MPKGVGYGQDKSKKDGDMASTKKVADASREREKRDGNKKR